METFQFKKVRQELINEATGKTGRIQASIFFVWFPIIIGVIFMIFTDGHFKESHVNVGIIITLLVDVVGMFYIMEHPIGKITITDATVKEEINRRVAENNKLLETKKKENQELELSY